MEIPNIGSVRLEYRDGLADRNYPFGPVTRDSGKSGQIWRQIWNLRKIWGRAGLFRVCSGIPRPKNMPDRKSSRSAPTEPSKPGRSMYFGSEIPERTRTNLPDPNLCVKSKFAVIFVRATRSRELRARTGKFGRRARLGILTEPNRPNIRIFHKILTMNTQTWVRIGQLGWVRGS